MNPIRQYTLVSETKDRFEEVVKRLVDSGFVPSSDLVVTVMPGVYQNESYVLYSQTFKKI